MPSELPHKIFTDPLPQVELVSEIGRNAHGRGLRVSLVSETG